MLICTIRDPVTGQIIAAIRYVAQKAEAYLKSRASGISRYFGPELEHFVFNEVRYDHGTNLGYHEINAGEANRDTRRRRAPASATN